MLRVLKVLAFALISASLLFLVAALSIRSLSGQGAPPITFSTSSTSEQPFTVSRDGVYALTAKVSGTHSFNETKQLLDEISQLPYRISEGDRPIDGTQAAGYAVSGTEGSKTFCKWSLQSGHNYRFSLQKGTARRESSRPDAKLLLSESDVISLRAATSEMNAWIGFSLCGTLGSLCAVLLLVVQFWHRQW